MVSRKIKLKKKKFTIRFRSRRVYVYCLKCTKSVGENRFGLVKESRMHEDKMLRDANVAYNLNLAAFVAVFTEFITHTCSIIIEIEIFS